MWKCSYCSTCAVKTFDSRGVNYMADSELFTETLQVPPLVDLLVIAAAILGQLKLRQ